MKRISLLFLSLIFSGIVNMALADYPIVGYRFLADPGAMVYNGRVYVYCSNDDENGDDGYDMSSIVCVSSSDLKNWTDHGVVFDVPRDASWSGKSWAPSPVYRDGKFYLYFGNGGSAIGVAVSDSPTGPFADPLGRSLVSGSTPGVQPFDGWLFDPMTFVDDDGQAYMYFGGNGEGNLRVIRLNEDMISIQGSAERFTVPYFFEAAWVHKHNGTYYFSYSTNPSNGIRIDYMTSTDPMSGFTYQGVMSPQPPNNNNNNHQAVFQMNGNWYQMYHNRIVASQTGVGTAYHRNLAVDAFSHRADGTIVRMVNTVDGVTQLKYLDPFVRVEAETMSEHNGIETEVCNAGGMNLSYLDNGDWTMVEGVDFGTIGASSFTASVASPEAGGTIEVRLGSPTGTIIGTLEVPNTGGYQAWQEVTIPVDITTGVHDVYFTFSGGFNVDFWSFSEAAGAPEVSLVSPLESDTIFEGEEVTIDVTVSDEDGTITNVFYYINEELVQEEWVAPYAFIYVFENSGTYEIRAVATDNDGNQREDAISVNVYIPQGPYQGIVHAIPGIIQFEEYDVGGNGFAYFDGSPGSETGVDFRVEEDVDIEACTDQGGGYNLGWATAGEWLEYTVEVQHTGIYDVDFRVSCNGDGRAISLSMDGQNLVSEVAIPNTAGWQAWQTITVNGLELEAGRHVLRMTVGDADYVNLNYMQFNDVITGLPTAVSSMKVFPNPFSNVTQIEIQGTATYSILSSSGVILESGLCESNCSVGNDLPFGLYLLKLESEGGQQTVKLIKR